LPAGRAGAVDLRRGVDGGAVRRGRRGLPGDGPQLVVQRPAPAPGGGRGGGADLGPGLADWNRRSMTKRKRRSSAQAEGRTGAALADLGLDDRQQRVVVWSVTAGGVLAIALVLTLVVNAIGG